MKAIILGSGSSGGVPRITGTWGAADPAQPRNRRTRCSLYIEAAGLRLVIDTSPDFRQQALDNQISRLDAVLYTHDHADQCHGIDDLRGFYIEQRATIPLFASAYTLQRLKQRFDYCFESHHGYPALVSAFEIQGPFSLPGPDGTLAITPFPVQHGPIEAFGFHIENLAYIPDVSEISGEKLAALHGINTIIVDALRYRPHPTHTHLARTLGWIKQIQPKKAILTNLHIDMDYDTLRQSLPAQVEPAYDGMVIDC